MEENMNFELDQEPAAETPAAPKKRIKPAVLIVGAVILCAALIVGIVLATLFAKSPFEKTMRAVFPSTELFEELVTEGGTLTVDGELADDLLGEGLQEPFCFSADYAFSLDGTLVTLTAGAKDDRVDLSFLQDEKGLQMYSDRLLGDKAYGVAFDGLMDAIDASPFAPKSGTEYALPRDVYDMIDRYADLLEEEPQTFEETSLVFAKAYDAMLKKAEIYKKTETVSLVGGDAKAKVYSYTFDADALDAFVKVLCDEWENNEAFRGEIEYFDTDGKIASFIEKTLKELEVRENTFPKMESPFEDLEVTCKYAVKGGYLVYADCLITESGGSKASTISFAVKFTEKPKKDPSYDVELSAAFGGKTEDRYVLTYRKADDGKRETWVAADEMAGKYLTVTADYGKDDAFSLTVQKDVDVDVSDDVELSKAWQWGLEGTLLKDDDIISLTVDNIQMPGGNDGTTFEIKDSFFMVTVRGGDPVSFDRKECTDILSMSVAELNELGAKVEGALTDALESIGTKLGAQLVHDTYMPNVLATVRADGNLSDYAYDRSNGHLFFAYDLGTSGEIWMYDAKTMELLDKLMLGHPVRAIDADGGYLVFAYDKTGQQTAYVHSSADMTYIKEFDYMDYNTFYPEMEYPGDVLVDGDRLIYITGDQHVSLYFTDIKTDKTVRAAESFYEGKLSIDRKNHVVAVLDNYLSACDLVFFSTVSCDCIEQIDRFGMSGQYLKGSAHFDGYAFWATADEWYTSDGNGGTLATALGFSSRDALAQVVYRDENLIVTLETDMSGKPCTAFYRADGTYCDSVDELYLWMYPTDGNHYLAAYQDGNKTVFAYCELVEGQTIG